MPVREPFELGGKKIPPGTRTSIDVPVMQLSTHTPMAMPVHVIHGRRPGPTLFICAALHGDEINGVEIIRRLLRLTALNRVRGTLIAVPIVNVFGYITLSRYLPDRRDLNRSFPGSSRGSMAGRLADIFVKEVVSKATHGIDLHTGAIHRDNYPQIRANLDDPDTLRLAEAFGAPIMINADIRPGSLRAVASARDIPVPVLVYEAGEALRFDEVAIRAGVNGVTRVMRTLNMLPGRKPGPRPGVVVRNSGWVRAPASGGLRTLAPLGTWVSAGDTLGVVSDPFGETETPISSRYDGVIVGRTNLPIVQEGDAAFHIGLTEGTKADAMALDFFEPHQDYEMGETAEISEEPEIV
jgi:predicted deacylase